MNIGSHMDLIKNQIGENRREDIRKEQAAIDFEELFARHLVKEMTKDSFQMSDNSGGFGQSNEIYREFITDALAGELAAQRRLGMADLVSEYWGQTEGSDKKGQLR
ncbi:MAG: hypothetical protein JJU46_05660 [Balneolaceae bacterium]|nr:hypothetical protein [Balneolaceae bacterium]MCH8547293.1 hypothetical protein [Balneolaceae bacterium]